jgi:YfiH family protein
VIVRTDRWDTGVEVHHGTTDRRDGDFAIGGEPVALAAARRAVVDLPWVWLHQVHGARVHVVEPGAEASVQGRDGDALVTAGAGVVLAVQTADCVPVTFSTPEGVIGVAHAGWRGIEAGVLEATVDALAALGATRVRADLGPCIHAGCYEFGAADLDRLTVALGRHVEGRTADGQRALDTVAATRSILAGAGVELDDRADPACTACDGASWYSHRARGDAGRLATVVWRDRVAGPGEPG